MNRDRDRRSIEVINDDGDLDIAYEGSRVYHELVTKDQDVCCVAGLFYRRKDAGS